MNRLFPCITFVITLFACTPSKDNKPNILLVVADDLAFTDLGSFGGEIEIESNTGEGTIVNISIPRKDRNIRLLNNKHEPSVIDVESSTDLK